MSISPSFTAALDEFVTTVRLRLPARKGTTPKTVEEPSRNSTSPSFTRAAARRAMACFSSRLVCCRMGSGMLWFRYSSVVAPP